MPTDDHLDALAGSVSDGSPVDWKTAESDAGASRGEASVRALRDVARIADFNRGLQRSPLSEERRIASNPEPERWGDLTLLERVGAGASGEVWRAWDARLHREVALKFLQMGESASGASSHASLLDEARALARVRHPGVVAVHGIAEHDGRAGMWMEFLRGATLDDEIERRGALPTREVARIGLELCRALEAVDAAGLVHGDLKPANIVIEAAGRVVLTDFGLGRRRRPAGPEGRRVSGTPIFMSPGLLAGEAATRASDLYALGVTLRWALTGRPPFRAGTLEELRTESKAGPSTSLAAERPDAPTPLVAAIDRAMAPEAGARFASATEMGGALQAVLDETRAAGSASRRSPRRMLAAAALAVALLAAAWLAPRLLESPEQGPLDGTAPRSTGGIGVAGDLPESGSPSAASASYEVEATLIDRSAGAFRRLAPGDRVAPGDQLSLEFRATKAMWVYVLNEDERGEKYLLFPQPLFDRGNPIPPNATTTLPGSIGGRENGWTVTSRGGREHFLIVASPEPVEEIESELAQLPAAKPGHPIEYASLSANTVERLRGVGGVSAP